MDCKKCEYKIAMDNVSGELPEKRKIGYVPRNGDGIPEFSDKQLEDISFNQTLDLIRPGWAKKELRIEGLKKSENNWWQKRWVNNDVGVKLLEIKKKWLTAYQCALNYQERSEKQEEELATLKAKIGELEVNAKLGNISYKQAIQLQQQNAKLKEEVETVRLESYGEALKNKRLRELLSEESDKKFINHIKKHLSDGAEVICKICGKLAKEIAKEKE